MNTCFFICKSVGALRKELLQILIHLLRLESVRIKDVIDESADHPSLVGSDVGIENGICHDDPSKGVKKLDN